MKLLKITDGADPNYLVTIVKCPDPKPHPNADRLQILTIFGNDVIVAKDMYTPGELLCYFPVESCISQKFLSWANLLDNATLNADGKTKGFFNTKNGRVKAISLRSIPSQGFVFKVSKLKEYYNVDINTFKIGDIFDSVGDDILVTKYIRGDSKTSKGDNPKKIRVPEWVNTIINIFPRPVRRALYICINSWYNRNNQGIKSQILDGEFRHHYKTEHLGKNVYTVSPDDSITITEKLHGTSAIFANIICKKPFSFYRLFLNKMGGKISDQEYKFVYSSRSVLKNRRDGKFTDDVWGIIGADLQSKIPEGYSIYGEIVGFTPSGKTIQKNYDYGVAKTECAFRVYRITYNLTEGYRELDWYDIVDLCNDIGLETVPVHYTGLAKDLFNIPIDDNWNDNFLSKLKDTYLDKSCKFCTNKVINEGIVLRNETKQGKSALKFKSPLFTVAESAARDNNESDIEEDS